MYFTVRVPERAALAHGLYELGSTRQYHMAVHSQWEYVWHYRRGQLVCLVWRTYVLIIKYVQQGVEVKRPETRHRIPSSD